MGFTEEDKRLIQAVNTMAEFMKDNTGGMTEMGFYALASRVMKNIYKESRVITGQEAILPLLCPVKLFVKLFGDHFVSPPRGNNSG